MSQHRVSLRRQLLVALFCLCALGYLGVHAFHGRHGLESRQRLLARSEFLSGETGRLEAVRLGLARDVALLSQPVPDPAFVEELATDILGFARPNDRVVIRRPYK
jgi:cell division protein FtsB